MNLAKAVILICISSLIFSCDNEKPRNENEQDTRTVVNPERIYIAVSENANYMDDFNESIKAGDLRFVGVMGYSLIVPDVPDYHELYSKSNGVKIIEGTTDSYALEDSIAFKNRGFFDNYSRQYNLLLLEYLNNDKEQ